MKGPTIGQRAYLLREVRNTCECCNMRQYAGAIFREIKIEGTQIADADADAAISEAVDDRNLLI